MNKDRSQVLDTDNAAHSDSSATSDRGASLYDLSQFSDAAIYAEAERRNERNAELAITHKANEIKLKGPMWFNYSIGGDERVTVHTVTFYRFENPVTGHRMIAECARYSASNKTELAKFMRTHFETLPIADAFRFFSEDETR